MGIITSEDGNKAEDFRKKKKQKHNTLFNNHRIEICVTHSKGLTKEILPIKRAKVAWESRAIAAADFLFPEKNNEYEKLYKCPFLLRRNTFLGDTRYF